MIPLAMGAMLMFSTPAWAALVGAENGTVNSSDGTASTTAGSGSAQAINTGIDFVGDLDCSSFTSG
ncbi:hypothetical protein AAHH79_43420, partial [Burkholderia pseudomallei]